MDYPAGQSTGFRESRRRQGAEHPPDRGTRPAGVWGRTSAPWRAG